MTPVNWWQLRKRVGACSPTTLTSHDDSSCSDYRSWLIQWESPKWAPELKTCSQRFSAKESQDIILSLPYWLSWLRLLRMCMSEFFFPLSGKMVECECVKGTQDQTPMGETFNPVALPEGHNRKALSTLNQPLPSTIPALSSSWPFPFVHLSGSDNGGLSVTQSLTQIHSLRRTASGIMGIS